MTAEKAIEVLKNEIECVKTDCVRSECRDCHLVMSEDDILDALNMAIDALSAQEVRHGKWLKNAGKPTCNQCGEVNYLEPNFCPNCGANMYGSEDVR